MSKYKYLQFLIKGIGPPESSNILPFFVHLKWSSMCVETCVKISDTSEKNEEVIAYAS